MGQGASPLGGCCGSHCGRPAVVNIEEPYQPQNAAKPMSHADGDQINPGDPRSGFVVPAGSDSEENLADADGWSEEREDLRRRVKGFAKRAMAVPGTSMQGVPCRFVDRASQLTQPAKYSLDPQLRRLAVETSSDGETVVECELAEIQNVWIRADSGLAQRAHKELRDVLPNNDLACLLLIDAPTGMIGLVERSAQAREEFLDCMAVLIAAQRVRAGTSGCQRRAAGPPHPEALLRPPGKSLRSQHLNGPICQWLASVVEDRADNGAMNDWKATAVTVDVPGSSALQESKIKSFSSERGST